ncbi:hypothetical protein P7K49_019030 [Saguinus oedipus]|uniref:Uncharacterized protein n=1 Tax=Saguinus oedipus TaxID=9490 RepID=A0ABQ9UX60_SAGOE|nr:hypothetical protein P7K49_019030 [Saguinus oedipus]
MVVPICSSSLTQVCCSGRLWRRRGRFLLKRGSGDSMAIRALPPGPGWGAGLLKRFPGSGRGRQPEYHQVRNPGGGYACSSCWCSHKERFSALRSVQPPLQLVDALALGRTRFSGILSKPPTRLCPLFAWAAGS